MQRMTGKICFLFVLFSLLLLPVKESRAETVHPLIPHHTVLSFLFKKKDIELDEENDKEDGAHVHDVVYQFGNQLKLVSLLAPDEVLRESILEYYGDLVTPPLLKQWLQSPRRAPGRYTSSPWPERIEILEIKRTGKKEYEVYGHIIEVTSASQNAIVARRPITLHVKKWNERWLIHSVELGDYK